MQETVLKKRGRSELVISKKVKRFPTLVEGPFLALALITTAGQSVACVCSLGQACAAGRGQLIGHSATRRARLNFMSLAA